MVSRVHDGDSGLVVIDGAEVEFRLEGVNAPEREECLHDEATDHLAGLLGDGRVRIQSNQVDQFGRILAYFWRGETSVNLDMVSNGFAIATTPADDDPIGEAILSAEERAVSQRAGLWAEDACGGDAPLPPVSIDPRASNFDPPGPDDQVLEEERVVLTSEATVGLGGWTVRDESSAHRCFLPPGSQISPGTGLVITSVDVCWDPGDTPVWNNDGDLVLVLDAEGSVAARHRYHD